MARSRCPVPQWDGTDGTTASRGDDPLTLRSGTSGPSINAGGDVGHGPRLPTALS